MRVLVACSTLLCVAMSAGCAPRAPLAELTAYSQSFDDSYAVSNDVLDLIAEFERRNERAVAMAPAGGGGIDPSLLLEPTAGPIPGTPQAACAERDRLGPDEYCFDLRHAFASVGDPPATAAFRRTLSVIRRYNALLVAYAQGHSGDLLTAELTALESELNGGLSAAGTSIAEVGAAFALLKPLGSLAGSAGDRERFREFLLANHSNVDAALDALMRGTEPLYDTIAQDIQRRRIDASAADDAALDRQRDALRQILANLTFLLGDSRELLGELVLAVENPDSLESRLRNLDAVALEGRIDAAAVRRDLTMLGVGVQ